MRVAGERERDRGFTPFRLLPPLLPFSPPPLPNFPKRTAPPTPPHAPNEYPASVHDPLLRRRGEREGNGTCFWRIMLASASIFERKDFPSPSDFLPLFCSAAFFWAWVQGGRSVFLRREGERGRVERGRHREFGGAGMYTFSRACIWWPPPSVSQSVSLTVRLRGERTRLVALVATCGGLRD